jgi:protein gp37
MAEVSKIAWTDSTFNHWEGCTKIGPGCDACYAAARNQRFAGGANWGPGAPRRLTSLANRRHLSQWNAEAARTGYRPWVFCFSLADVFDNEVDPAWRADFFDAVRRCPNLRFQIVTKRIGNALKMLPAAWPAGFDHVGIIATMVNQAEVDRDMPKLAEVKRGGAMWIGLSIEPQLEELQLGDWLAILDWIITGGESYQVGHRPRFYDFEWARSLILQGRGAGVPVFVKQAGSNVADRGRSIRLPHPKGENPDEWPPEIRVREMPRIYEDERRRLLI